MSNTATAAAATPVLTAPVVKDGYYEIAVESADQFHARLSAMRNLVTAVAGPRS